MSSIIGDNIINNSLQKLTNVNGILQSNPFKKKETYFEINWKTYRILAFIVFVISFVVMKKLVDYFQQKYNDEGIVKFLGIVSFFFIINFGIFLFMNVYYKYRKSVKGSKGATGDIGVRGDQGESSYCNICDTKTGVMRKEKKKIQKEIINKDIGLIDFNKLNNNNEGTGWKEIPNKITDNGKEYTILIPQKAGVGCSNCQSIPSSPQPTSSVPSSASSSIGTTPSQPIYPILNDSQKPIIGATLNYNKKSGDIYTLQYYADKNKNHNPTKYNIKLFGGKDGKFGKKDNYGTSSDFRCQPNSAVNKIDVIDNGTNIKGLRFYCSDIETGKSTKAIDSNGRLRKSINFGRSYNSERPNLHKATIECKPFVYKANDKHHFKPTFISNVGAEFNDNKVKNLHFYKCSFYKDFENEN